MTGSNPSPGAGGASGAANQDPCKGEDSWWKQWLDFLYDGGFRSTIVLSVTLGAIGITVFSSKVCEPVPTQMLPPQQSLRPAGTLPPPPPAPGSPQTPAQQPTSTPAGSAQPILVPAQPNPICNKYFELAFMVIGGYLGLSLPSKQGDERDKPAGPGGAPSLGGAGTGGAGGGGTTIVTPLNQPGQTEGQEQPGETGQATAPLTNQPASQTTDPPPSGEQQQSGNPSLTGAGASREALQAANEGRG